MASMPKATVEKNSYLPAGQGDIGCHSLDTWKRVVNPISDPSFEQVGSDRLLEGIIAPSSSFHSLSDAGRYFHW